ncbi:drebrin-like protein [Hyla sarda]|uniref:drebrin-like protein n=1 Tax=Hyla sarda TaxID=327740 RepID=UPI0024C21AE4|nr:drebrin-like protein [Hyla sarda]
MSALNLDTYSLSLITAREDILSARSSTDWAVFTYEKKWSLKLLDSGVGGLEELLKKFNENLVQYGLCQVSDPSSGVQRIILIYWVGENVDAFRKGVAAEHLPAIRRFFKEANVVLGAQKVGDITQEVVVQALSRVPPPARAFQKPRIPAPMRWWGPSI